VAAFLGLAARRLASREAALSADSLEQRFEKSKLIGDSLSVTMMIMGFARPMATTKRLSNGVILPLSGQSSLFQTMCGDIDDAGDFPLPICRENQLLGCPMGVFS